MSAQTVNRGTTFIGLVMSAVSVPSLIQFIVFLNHIQQQNNSIKG